MTVLLCMDICDISQEKFISSWIEKIISQQSLSNLLIKQFLKIFLWVVKLCKMWVRNGYFQRLCYTKWKWKQIFRRLSFLFFISHINMCWLVCFFHFSEELFTPASKLLNHSKIILPFLHCLWGFILLLQPHPAWSY